MFFGWGGGGGVQARRPRFAFYGFRLKFFVLMERRGVGMGFRGFGVLHCVGFKGVCGVQGQSSPCLGCSACFLVSMCAWRCMTSSAC